MDDVRKATNRILELVDEGIIDSREMLQNALFYMCEHDVAEMLEMYEDDLGLNEEDE